jgi:hypothetical protein
MSSENVKSRELGDFMEDNNALSMFDFSEDDVAEALDKRTDNAQKKDGRICACGHAVKRHREVRGISICQPSAMNCMCRYLRAVVETDDIRFFLQKTTGKGQFHALSMGMASAIKAGKEVKWAVSPVVCDYCKEPGKLLPVPVTQQSVFVDREAENTVLLCRDCYSKGA